MSGAKNPNDICCSAGCYPCAQAGYWVTKQHRGCCKSTICSESTPERMERTTKYINAQRREGKSVQASGALKTFTEQKAKKADPLKSWLGDTFEADVAEWLKAEEAHTLAVRKWLRAEKEFGKEVTRWLNAEIVWRVEAQAWLDAEADFQAQQVQAEVQVEVDQLAALRAKAAELKASRVVHLVRDEAAPVRAHSSAHLARQVGKH